MKFLGIFRWFGILVLELYPNSGYCTPTQWATYATTGGPWVFAGTPGYQAASNGRTVWNIYLG